MNSVTPAVAPRFVVSAMFTGIAMLTAVLWMPATLGALAQAYGLGTAQLSRLAFAELAGFLLGTLFTSNRSILQLRRLVPVGCALVIVASAWFILQSDRAPVTWSRLIAGFGSGIGFGYGLKTCAASERPTRSFGILTAAMSFVMVIGFQFVAYLTESAGPATAGVPSDLVRQAYRIAAENVPGVRSVKDHLAWVDALSGMVLYQSDDEPVQAKAS
jgi:hypothetical protein